MPKRIEQDATEFCSRLEQAAIAIRRLRAVFQPLTVEPNRGESPLFDPNDEGRLLEELRRSAKKTLSELKTALRCQDHSLDEENAKALFAVTIGALRVLDVYRLDKAQPGNDGWRKSYGPLIDADRAKEIDRPLQEFEELARSVLDGMPTAVEQSAVMSIATPDDLISAAVATLKFIVSRQTLQRAAAEGRIHSYRPPDAAKNSPHSYSESSLARVFQRR